jgi:hypothetical protein
MGTPTAGSVISRDARAATLSGRRFRSNSSSAVEFRLKRGTRITGKVLAPDGTPAIEAQVYAVGKDLMPTIQPDRMQSLGLAVHSKTEPDGQATTDAQGLFSLKPVAGADCLMVLHGSGCRMIRLEDLRSGQVVLQDWGRTQGQARVGASPGMNLSIGLKIAWSSSDELRIPFSGVGGRTDDLGRFSLERIPPGKYRACQIIHLRSDGTGPFGRSHPTEVLVQPGTVTQLTLGGTGRIVMGQIQVIPAGARVDWTIGRALRRRQVAQSLYFERGRFAFKDGRPERQFAGTAVH